MNRQTKRDHETLSATHPFGGTEDPKSATEQTTNIERVGDYELFEVIGRGGMGVVYKARQFGLDRTVAVKMVLDARVTSPEDRTRFHTEAKAAAKLDHRGIVSIHEIGEHQGRPFYSMDYVDGASMADVLENRLYSPYEAAQLTQQVAQAVAHAHANNVLHRDLKPSNILLDAEGSPRIADFGLAKLLHDDLELTQSGQVMGTPSYMSPEQAAGRIDKIGPASDVYGVGAILYAALTGYPPFQGATPVDILHSVKEDLPVSPHKLNPLIDRDLETICLKCLEKRTSDRYENATALAHDLGKYLNREPITARSQGYVRILLHWCRRPQRVLETAGVILIIAAFYGVAVAIGLCVLFFNWVPIANPTQFAFMVTLDFTGFAICLLIGIGILARRGFAIWGGLLVGCGMTCIVLALALSGFEAGGVLSDPFIRLFTFFIFGFVGCIMIGACLVALLSHSASHARRITLSGSTRRVENLATTVDRK